jgi:acetylornithine deacetylase/succinyl-diaminopimelate desuccinylase-like protein
MDAIEGWIAANDPGARVVPTMLPGFTDSRTFRDAFPECVAYGFFPHRHMSLHEAMPLIHAADERIDVRDLGYAASFFRDVCKELLGA